MNTATLRFFCPWSLQIRENAGRHQPVFVGIMIDADNAATRRIQPLKMAASRSPEM